MHVMAWALVALLVAGCADGPDPEPVADVTEESREEPRPVVVEEIPPSTNGTAGGVAFEVTGQAGAFVVAYHPLPESRQEIELDYSYEAHAGGASAAFSVAPTLATGDPDAWEVPRFWPFEQSVLTTVDGTFDASRHGSVGASSSNGIAGIFFAFAADGPWSYKAQLVWGDGPVVGPAYVQAGTNATFRLGGDVTGAPGGAGAGRASLEAPVPGPGWTHIEVVDQPFQPIEVRQFEFELANGHAVSGASAMYGYYALGGQASSSGRVDYVGSLADVAGTGSAELTYAAGSLGVDLGYVHMPLDVLPPGLTTADYAGSTWPFPDGIPVPP